MVGPGLFGGEPHALPHPQLLIAQAAAGCVTAGHARQMAQAPGIVHRRLGGRTAAPVGQFVKVCQLVGVHHVQAAAHQLTLKFEILNDEFNVLYARNPIHHIESRVKTPESIAAKLLKKGLPVSIEAARERVNDIAGVRVVCSYIDDVYRVAEMLERQKDIEIVKRQDYIKTPNYNGYRSLHLDIRVPVYLSDRTEYVVAEIQIRTIAMDFWASLEHDIRYKADKSRLPEGINEEMLAVSGKIADIDRQMQDMYRRIRAAETEKDE